MNNFLNFIKEDIESKKTLLSSMPINTKPNKKKFNQKIATITSKYNEYKEAIKKYIDIKSKSFKIETEENDSEKLSSIVSGLERVRFILNPSNTYLEKMGFDSLLYQISNYSDFKFNSLIDIINEFLDKFELADIVLQGYDFNYTCYVKEYMTSFLEIRKNKSDNYDKISEIFEKIYWVNPEIIEHIELNFRKLIKKNEKKFIEYIAKQRQDVLRENKIINYEDCMEKLEEAYIKLANSKKETITDITNLAKDSKIDINNYFEDSKTRIGIYSDLIVDTINFYDKEVMDKFYDNLDKLRTNLKEYKNYMEFSPLIEDFKTEYEKHMKNDDKVAVKNNISKELKEIESKISSKEANLEKINKDIFHGKDGLLKYKNGTTLKQLMTESVKKAKELYGLYKELDEKYFLDKVLSILNNHSTISELLHLYYSFDYFKKKAIKKVFAVTNYNDIVQYSDSFDMFSMNLTNVIVNGMYLFDENNIAKVIVNKYRFNNINLGEDNITADNIDAFLEKIELPLRIRVIENSSTTVEKIWFVAAVEKMG